MSSPESTQIELFRVSRKVVGTIDNVRGGKTVRIANVALGSEGGLEAVLSYSTSRRGDLQGFFSSWARMRVLARSQINTSVTVPDEFERIILGDGYFERRRALKLLNAGGVVSIDPDIATDLVCEASFSRVRTTGDIRTLSYGGGVTVGLACWLDDDTTHYNKGPGTSMMVHRTSGSITAPTEGVMSGRIDQEMTPEELIPQSERVLSASRVFLNMTECLSDGISVSLVAAHIENTFSPAS